MKRDKAPLETYVQKVNFGVRRLTFATRFSDTFTEQRAGFNEM